jgi:hypothetical protein
MSMLLVQSICSDTDEEGDGENIRDERKGNRYETKAQACKKEGRKEGRQERKKKEKS